jgi:copper transport protein
VTKPRQLLLLVAVAIVCVLGFASPARAHNSLVSSDPADGAELAAAPSQMMFRFDKSVPLDTVSVELIDGTGIRTELEQFAHGPAGDTEVIATLPAIGAGEVTVRWRLVGPDGHPITGRVSFTVAAAATTTAAATTLAPGTSTSVPAATPTSVPPPPTTTTPAIFGGGGVDGDQGDGFAEPYSTPDAARWLFRAASYVAIIVIGGVIATSAFVWNGAARHDTLRRVVLYALGTAVVLAVVQLLVIASDIEAKAPWSAWGGVSAAFETDAGTAFGLRILLLGIVGAVLYLVPTISEQTRWLTAGAVVLLLLGTWAFAGHSRSMRWPILGIPLDIAHHAAAAAWLGGLAIVGLVAARECSVRELTGVVQRFASVAKYSVIVVVGTGLLQGVRLVGSPGRLFEANHGRYLVVKLVALGVMLWIADVNRRRVGIRFQKAATATRRAVENLRRAMATELALGLAIIGITAAMVVSPPAVADDQLADRGPVAEASGTTPTSSPPSTLGATTTTGPTTSAAGACAMGQTLQLGASGDDVRCLQEALIANSYLSGPSTGEFDDMTDAAVREYQEASGLGVDGIVGPITAESLAIWGGS